MSHRSRTELTLRLVTEDPLHTDAFFMHRVAFHHDASTCLHGRIVTERNATHEKRIPCGAGVREQHSHAYLVQLVYTISTYSDRTSSASSPASIPYMLVTLHLTRPKLCESSLPVVSICQILSISGETRYQHGPALTVSV